MDCKRTCSKKTVPFTVSPFKTQTAFTTIFYDILLTMIKQKLIEFWNNCVI